MNPLKWLGMMVLGAWMWLTVRFGSAKALIGRRRLSPGRLATFVSGLPLSDEERTLVRAVLERQVEMYKKARGVDEEAASHEVIGVEYGMVFNEAKRTFACLALAERLGLVGGLTAHQTAQAISALCRTCRITEDGASTGRTDIVFVRVKGMLGKLGELRGDLISQGASPDMVVLDHRFVFLLARTRGFDTHRFGDTWLAACLSGRAGISFESVHELSVRLRGERMREFAFLLLDGLVDEVVVNALLMHPAMLTDHTLPELRRLFANWQRHKKTVSFGTDDHGMVEYYRAHHAMITAATPVSEESIH